MPDAMPGGSRVLLFPAWPVLPGDVDPDAPAPRSADEAAAAAGEGWPDVPGLAPLEWHRDASSAIVPIEATLMRALGLALPDGAAVPSANAWREDLTGDARADVEAALTAGEGLVRADPVHLSPDRDTAMLLAPEALGLAPGESAALVATLAAFLEQDGLRLHAASPERWYLVGATLPVVDAAPPQALSGRRVVDFEGSGNGSGNGPGADAGEGDSGGAGVQAVQALVPRALRGLASEIEMLLHGHPVNAARRVGGRLAVTGLHLHGSAGAWPARVTDPGGGAGGGAGAGAGADAAGDTPVRPALVRADDPFARAAAEAAGVRCVPLSETDAEASPGTVIVYDRALERAVLASDGDAAAAQLSRLARAWIVDAGPDAPGVPRVPRVPGASAFTLHAGDGRVGSIHRQRRASLLDRAIGAVSRRFRKPG